MKEMYYQSIGWYGVVAILMAYAATTLEYIPPDSLTYLFLNSSGALALIIQSAAIRNWQLIVLNLVWLAVAAVGLSQLLLQ